ncbi:glycosyltransferase [bacterium]|nr:glycosyltransferase [bacterium]
MSNKEKISYFNKIATKRKKWKKLNNYYYQDLENFFQFVIPKGHRVLEIGCGTGEILDCVKPSFGLGLDFSYKMIQKAREQFSDLHFVVMDAEQMSLNCKFDYIIISDLVGHLDDIQKTIAMLKPFCHQGTRIVLTYYNYMWEPILQAGEFFGLKMKQKLQNWLSSKDLMNLFTLGGFDPFKCGRRLLCPVKVPFLSTILNRYIARLGLIRNLCLIQYIIARPMQEEKKEYSVSVLVPARNEAGNIENAILRTPEMGKGTELIFVEGGSTDNTLEVIQQMVEKYKGTRKIVSTVQEGTGKGDAVRKGFGIATGDILMILDADLTVPPEDLEKFYDAISNGKGEFINGSRMIYPMEKDAMRFFNILGNKFFSLMFSWLLDQRFKDTLCGTKVLFRKDYLKLVKGRKYFGDFDPFGDFDLIFGASKLNLKIVEVPVRYKSRTYGDTNIERWKHGVILLRMCLFASRKIKFT